MFTLSGAHVFPLYDAAVKATPPMPIIDVRHEQTAVFAAAATIHQVDEIASGVDKALRVAQRPHRGPVFLDMPMDQLFSRAEITASAISGPDEGRPEPDRDRIADIATLLGAAERPVLILGS